MQGNLAIFNTGMAKTTTEDSDTDESYDSLPELVACTDDEVRKLILFVISVYVIAFMAGE